MDRTIIHVDMDAYYAAVEVRDNPSLAGKPLIIGALPGQRGVVATCSYEARKYGIRSAMPIAEAYRLCPDGVYLRPNMRRYAEVSDVIHEIWTGFTDIVEFISLDEGFLDVSESLERFDDAVKVALEIKKQTKEKTGLTCSVGIGYSLMSAKLASEEKKPDGLFEILNPEALVKLIIDRNVRVIYGVGPQTAAQLQKIGIHTVRDIHENRQAVKNYLGNHGKSIVQLADGIDNRQVAMESKSHSLGREQTFQKDITNVDQLHIELRSQAEELSAMIREKGIYCRTVTLKVTYKGMRKISRSISGELCDSADEIYNIAVSLLDKVEKAPIRLIGITLSGFTTVYRKQLSLFDP